jgi:hypothetical protein
MTVRPEPRPVMNPPDIGLDLKWNEDFSREAPWESSGDLHCALAIHRILTEPPLVDSALVPDRQGEGG